MLNYQELKDKPREFLAATGLTKEEFELLLPHFEAAYQQQYPSTLTVQGKARQRGLGAGVKSKLAALADQLFFILVYQKTNPLQTLHGLQFGIVQSRANYLIHRCLPVVQTALARMGMKPEREAGAVAAQPAAGEGGANLSLDGTERTLQRPTDPLKQRENIVARRKRTLIRTSCWSMKIVKRSSI